MARAYANESSMCLMNFRYGYVLDEFTLRAHHSFSRGVSEVPWRALRQQPNVDVVVTSHGGHLGYFNCDEGTEFVGDLAAAFFERHRRRAAREKKVRPAAAAHAAPPSPRARL